jgi:hypothetical protein
VTVRAAVGLERLDAGREANRGFDEIIVIVIDLEAGGPGA